MPEIRPLGLRLTRQVRLDPLLGVHLARMLAGRGIPDPGTSQGLPPARADDGATIGGYRHWTLGEIRMPTTRFTVHSSLPPDDVMAVLTDFGPARASRWPNIDEAHFKVHELGPDWAEVTEGTALGWERTRYSWDPEAGTVTIDTLDSNLWGPASGWRYQLRSTAGGTDLEVTLTRVPKSLLGRLVGTLIPIAGSLALRKQFETVLRKAERP